MSDHDDKIKAQFAQLDRVLGDHPPSCKVCNETRWDVKTVLHAPDPQTGKTNEVFCLGCGYQMLPEEVAKLLVETP